ncbi:D-ribitol-5-phosphate cytidylyltransferase isoform X4 [Bufo gargarizans]|uniref:D-ribitol-5-phosphate cytidylyltransferase isoform X4 n=1 Tax=Bufo gargarizans TaxID=30331 RepID=UPI001CF30FA3|nr:D-ribitol-5-phosphate cytidylyltransferase isoform X4 [Bufo gargarizans]
MEGVRRVAAVLPAGGSGERLGGCMPKQYCPVLGRPLISRTLEALERVGWISDIVVVVAAESVDLMKSITHRYRHKSVTLVEGGVTRHRSIFNGLRAFTEDHSLGPALQKPEVVIIHDAVRPFVDEETLLQVTCAARQYGCSDYDLDFGTECLHLALAYGKRRAKLLEGPPDLWKVTYKRDLYAAESIIKDRISKHLCIITTMKEEAVQIGFRLHENLKSRIKHVKAISSSMCRTPQDLQNIFQGQCYNYVCINVKDSDVEESRKLLELLQAAHASAYYQSVVVSVHLAFPEKCASEVRKLSEIREVAKIAQKSDILLYGLLINFSKEESELEDGVRQASEIISALITDRNPALTGQVMVA